MYSNDKLSVPDCLEQFDKYAAEFMKIIHSAPADSKSVEKFISTVRKATAALDNDQVSVTDRNALLGLACRLRWIDSSRGRCNAHD